ncbi:MAG: hypothetical protein ACSHXL_05695 [Bacteroidota bacterium]
MEEYTKEHNQRPQMLLVLCILSWISIGFSFLTNLLALLRGPFSPEQMEESKANMLGLVKEIENSGMDSFADMFSKVQHMAEVYNANHYAFYTFSILIFAVGLYGVIQMFIGKKIGFHLYIIYSILAVVQVYFFLTPAEIPNSITIIGVIISALFIFLYSRTLNWMK